jgi:hypothetical protein
MSAVSAPFGFVATRAGEDAARPYQIAPAYATAIYKNQAVTLDANGTITAAAAASDILGVFVGVEYIDADGRPQTRNSWPAGGVAGATNVTAYVLDDPEQEYLVQASGPIAAADIGAQADISGPNAGSAFLGLSQSMIGAIVAAAAQGQFRIVGIEAAVDNAAGDAFTRCLVRIARHQYVANKVTI